MPETIVIQRLPEPYAGPSANEAGERRKFLEDPAIRMIVSPAPRVPEKLLLGTLRDGRLRLKVPIHVRCLKENQDIIAEAVELDEFGFGKNLLDALRDLQSAIVELYFTLEQEQSRLGPDLQRTWTTLQEKISRRP